MVLPGKQYKVNVWEDNCSGHGHAHYNLQCHNRHGEKGIVRKSIVQMNQLSSSPPQYNLESHHSPYPIGS